MVSLCLNFRPARSAALKQNWLPYSSISTRGPSSTVPARVRLPFPSFPAPPAVGTVAATELLYKGTANTKTDPCFGNTVNGEENRSSKATDGWMALMRWVDNHQRTPHLSIYPSASPP